MKILYLITKSEAGGAQTHVYQLCKYFRAKNDIIVCAYPGGWLEEKCEELGILFVPNIYFSNSMNPFSVINSFFRIKTVIREVEPDIVHCHSSIAGFLGRLVVRNSIPTLYTAHGWGFNIGVVFFQKWISIFSERIVRRYTSKIICVSEFVKNLGIKYRIVMPNSCEVIYNGVERQEKILRTSKYIRICFVGRLSAPKRPLLLLKALQKLPKESQDIVRVSIVGDGLQKKMLEEYINTHDMECVQLLGALPREQIFDILHNSDIFVFLSDWEGFPITILEAMSVGLPIIASDVGGVREAVDEYNGILIVSNAVIDITEAIGRLCEDRALRDSMSDVSYARVQARFSLENMLYRVEDIYSEIIE